MIDKTLKTTTGRKVQFRFPTELRDITIGMQVQIEKAEDLTDPQLICILSGKSIDDIADIPQYALNREFGERMESLLYQMQYKFDQEAIPEFVKINGKKIKVINNLSIEPVGAYMASRDVIVDEINKAIGQNGDEDWKTHITPTKQSCALLLAHYFYCPATGLPYNEQHAEAFVSEIYKMPITEALPIARHFFFAYPNLWTEKR